MENPIVIVLLTVAGLVVLWLAIALILSGGNLQRVLLSKQAELHILQDAELAARVEALLHPPPPEPEKPVKLDPTPVRLLTVLQRDGRLVDFLMEDLTGAADSQIVAAVKQIHPKCQKALKDHVTLEPVVPQKEEESTEVPAGFDPSAIQLTGNVTGQPPFRGTVQHSGWRVRDIRLSPAPEGVDELVVQPAEVEIG